MRSFIARILINAGALWVATEYVEGVAIDPGLGSLFLVALVFGLVNAVLKPIVQFLSFPLIILTLGLFTLIINTCMFLFTDWLLDAFRVSGFWPAFWGALVVSLVSWFLSMVFVDQERKKKKD